MHNDEVKEMALRFLQQGYLKTENERTRVP
jgi:hypothetical protein